MLAGLEASSGRLASTINMPPLDVATLRQEWSALRRDLSRISPKQLPRIDLPRRFLQKTALCLLCANDHENAVTGR